MNQRWLWILLGVVAMLGVLLIGVIIGTGVTWFVFNVTPARAALEVEISPPPEPSTREGVLIAEVISGSPADQAGLQRGDIILKFDGQEVNTLTGLADLIRDREPGDRVELEIRRGDEVTNLSVELGEESGRTYLGIRTCNDSTFGLLPPKVRVLPFISGEPAYLIRKVVPESPAEKAGLQPGDQITAIDGNPVQADQSLAEIIQAHKPGDELMLEILRPGEDSPRQITVILGENPDMKGQAYLGIEYISIPGFRIRPLDEEKFPFHFRFEFPWQYDRQPRLDEPEA